MDAGRALWGEQTKVLEVAPAYSVEDLSLPSNRLQTTLMPAQQAVATALRKTFLIFLDDLLAAVREFLSPNVSRSGLER